MDLIFTFLEYSWTQHLTIWVPQSCPCNALKTYGEWNIARCHSKIHHSEVKGHHRPGSFTPEETCRIIIDQGLRVGLGNLKKRYLSYIHSNQTRVPRFPVRSPITIPINLPHITKKYTNLFLCSMEWPTDATICSEFISLQVHSTCFGRYTRPSSGVQV